MAKPFYLGRRSLRELDGVHPELIDVVQYAIAKTEQDFTVYDGLRTDAEQAEYVRAGVSKTLNSKHLVQKATGHGHAVDLVPYVNRRLRWELQACYEIARAMQEASTELRVPIRWGGAWVRLDARSTTPEELVEAYIDRKRATGRSIFIDAAHYELLDPSLGQTDFDPVGPTGTD